MVTKKEILSIVNKIIKYYGIDESIKTVDYEKEILVNEIFDSILEEITEEVMDRKMIPKEELLGLYLQDTKKIYCPECGNRLKKDGTTVILTENGHVERDMKCDKCGTSVSIDDQRFIKCERKVLIKYT